MNKSIEKIRSAVSTKIGRVSHDVSSPRFSIKEQAFFAKRLAFLIHAGIPILESLMILRDQATSRRITLVFESVVLDISNGQTLSKSLSKFPRVFERFAINIIAVGESSGILSDNLNYLAEELKKKQILKRKIVGAMVYPVFITVSTFGITGLLTVYIFPKIVPIFASINVDLPVSTRIVLFLSDFLRQWGLLLIVGIATVLVVFLVALRRSFAFHLRVDTWSLKIPLLGTLIQRYNLANSMRTLGLLLRSGVTLSEALPITSQTTANLVYRAQFEQLGEVVYRGEKMSVHLSVHSDLFPDVLAQMVAVGERSGNLSETLVYVSELYEGEVEDFTKNLSSMVEPVLMICMGIMVGFIAISIITPIYGITQHLQPR